VWWSWLSIKVCKQAAHKQPGVFTPGEETGTEKICGREKHQQGTLPGVPAATAQ